MSENPTRAHLETVLRGAGLSDEPEEFHSSIHSWRCEYPDRYGRCSCFADLLDDLVQVVQEKVTVINAEQAAEWAGQPLTEEQMGRLRDAVPHSSVPDAISCIVDGLGITDLEASEDQT